MQLGVRSSALHHEKGIAGQTLIGASGAGLDMAMMTADALSAAADLLGVGERASLNEIRARYHEALRLYHPDVSESDPGVAHEKTVRLTAAYELLCEYCLNHIFSFLPADLARELETAPADYWTERFGDDPIWG